MKSADTANGPGKLASFAVALVCVATGVIGLGASEWSLAPPARRAKDLAHRFDARFAGVRKAIPSGIEVVSYWSDDPDGGLRQLVHYAMTPVLVDEAVPPTREFLVVDVRKGGGAAPIEGYAVVHDFGQGVNLLRRVAASP